MAYSVDSSTDGCYPGTTCLINKLDIRDEKQLSDFEASITFAKASELEENPIDGSFDFEHYKAIHRFLFNELYDWAGEIRKVNISKKGTRFAKVDEIQRIADSCFGRLKDNIFFQDQDFEDFVDSIVDFYCVTNMLHPFREGNGRTQRIFITQLIRLNGYNIDFSEIDRDELMIATIQAAQGIEDHLRDIFSEAIVSEEQSFGFSMN